MILHWLWRETPRESDPAEPANEPADRGEDDERRAEQRDNRQPSPEHVAEEAK